MGKNTNLDNLLVRHTSEEDVLLVIIRVETYDVGDLAIAKAL